MENREWLDVDRSCGDVIVRGTPDPRWHATTFFPVLLCKETFIIRGVEVVEGKCDGGTLHLVRGLLYVVSVFLGEVAETPENLWVSTRVSRVWPTTVRIPPRQNANIVVDELRSPLALRIYWAIAKDAWRP